MSFMVPVVFLIVSFLLFRRYKKHTSLPTFDDYRSSHSELVKDGKITCYKCSGNDIFVKTVGGTPISLLNHHMCKTCGTTLFRPTT